MKLNDLALGLVVMALGLGVVGYARTFPAMAGMAYGPDFFPTLIGIGLALCGLALVVGGARRMAEPLVTAPVWFAERPARLRALAVIASVAFFALAVGYLGFLLTMLLLAAGLFAALGARPSIAVPLALILPFSLHYAFAGLLRVPLPRGPLERLLF